MLPLAVGRPGRRLVPAALVIGSMVPDLPYFVPPHRGSDWTHAASGPFTVDLVLGMIVLVVWHFLLYRPLCDFAPWWVSERLPERAELRGRRWGWAAVSVIIGALTHVVLDTFTHPGRLGTTQVGILTSYFGPFPAYRWFQFGLGAFGLIILLAWAGHWLAQAPMRPVPSALTVSQRRLGWVIVLAVFSRFRWGDDAARPDSGADAGGGGVRGGNRVHSSDGGRGAGGLPGVAGTPNGSDRAALRTGQSVPAPLRAQRMVRRAVRASGRAMIRSVAGNEGSE